MTNQILEKIEQQGSSNALSQGGRLKYLRNLAGLERKDMVQFDIEPGTLKHWENGTYSKGLSKKAQKKILLMCEKNGIEVDLKWILHGLGSNPIKHAIIKTPEKALFDTEKKIALLATQEESKILKEANSFRENNPDSLILIVRDDGMAPYYMPGDYVGGNALYHEAIDRLIGLDCCIVQTTKGELLLRKIKEGNEQGKYNLLCQNTDAKIKDIILYDIEIASAAYVVWHRRKNPNLKDL